MIEILLAKEAQGKINVYGVNGRPIFVPASFETEADARKWIEAHNGRMIVDHRSIGDNISGVYEVRV